MNELKGYGENEDVFMSEDEHKLRLLLAFKCTGIIKEIAEGRWDDDIDLLKAHIKAELNNETLKEHISYG